MEVTGYATLPSPPPSLALWAKVIWYLAESVAVGVGYSQFAYGQAINGTGGGEADPPPHEWRKWHVRYENLQSTDTADDQLFTLDVLNYTNGSIDSSWTQQDHIDVSSVIGTFCTAINAVIPPWLSCKRIVAYRMAFNPYSNPEPFAKSLSPTFDLSVNIPGTATGAEAAPQVCTTITEITPLRTHWGRMYTPTVAAPSSTTFGRFSAANVDAVSLAYANMATQLHLKEMFLVVPTTTQSIGGSPAIREPQRTLQNVIGCRVDDVPDVIRRRRYKNALYRKTHDVATP